MNVLTCDIPGLLILEPKVFGDARGFFLETWNRRRYAEAGLNADFVQDNVSFSRRGILRGLHFQNPNPQGKLLQVLAGEVFDVAVDIRRSSPTFGKWHGLLLSGENKRQFYVPPGFAHGNLFLEDTTIEYLCTGEYSQGCEAGVSPLDPGLDWSLCKPEVRATAKEVLAGRIVISEKDRKGLSLADWLKDPRSENFVYGKC